MTAVTVPPPSYPVQLAVDGHFSAHGGASVTYGAGATLFLGPLLMIVFRRKYPRWWSDWNLELQRLGNRVLVVLWLAAVVAVLTAWFEIVVTDTYPPFSLAA